MNIDMVCMGLGPRKAPSLAQTEASLTMARCLEGGSNHCLSRPDLFNMSKVTISWRYILNLDQFGI